MQELLNSAMAMHESGRLHDAASLYEKVLAEDETNVSALHSLGVLRHQQANDLRAVELINRALALQPNMPVWHANLAEAYRGLGQLGRAVGSCRLALKLWPNCVEALCNLGLSLQLMGQYEEAVAQFRRALELRDDIAAVHNNLGIALRELGQLDEALEHFRRAAALAPGFAPALTNLGQALVDRGRAEEALPHCQEAARLQPDLAVVHCNLGNALRALDRNSEARGSYLEALRLDPDLALPHARLGLTLLREDRPYEALPWLLQSVELEPNNADFHERLGDLYALLEEPAEGARCFERALALATDARPSLHLSLGQALMDEGRLAEAGEQYRIALQLAPESAQVRVNLGGLHEARGEMAEAEAAFRAALRVQPGAPVAHAQLATLLRGRLPAEDVAALEERLNDAVLGKRPRARLLFGLAHVLDARGEYDRAAGCMREANALSLELARGWRSWDPIAEEQFVGRLIDAYGAEFFARTTGFGLDSRRPVFVFGLPRSGTTLIEQILSSHSLVHGAGELRLAQRSFQALPVVMSRPEPPVECVARLDAESTRRLAEQHLGWLSALDGEGAARIVDKMPNNYHQLGLLATLFPRATFIHCRRDLRDVAVSCWATDFRMIRWANDAGHIAAEFGQHRRLLDHWTSVLPATIHEVDYEETVAELEGVARRLIAACGLEWEPACVEFHLNKRPVRTASVTQVRQPIYRRSVGRWRNYQTALADLIAKLPLDGTPAARDEIGTTTVEDLATAMV
ncbi:MAG: tetratricopeptide repeat-containing sulfotransferase family protein [Isosphaeraceae bacterium]